MESLRHEAVPILEARGLIGCAGEPFASVRLIRIRSVHPDPLFFSVIPPKWNTSGLSVPRTANFFNSPYLERNQLHDSSVKGVTRATMQMQHCDDPSEDRALGAPADINYGRSSRESPEHPTIAIVVKYIRGR